MVKCVFSKTTWRTFATGLHDPLGMLVREDGSVVVMQRPELTELVDVDGDGQADEYNTLCDDFGLSGNYHEFNFGPVEDDDGHLYFALNTASNGGRSSRKTWGVHLGWTRWACTPRCPGGGG